MSLSAVSDHQQRRSLSALAAAARAAAATAGPCGNNITTMLRQQASNEQLRFLSLLRALRQHTTNNSRRNKHSTAGCRALPLHRRPTKIVVVGGRCPAARSRRA